MKCTYIIFDDIDGFKKIEISKNEVSIYSEDDKITLDVDSMTVFNTLISLFSLKDSWKKKSAFNEIYWVIFENGVEKEEYKFNINNLPDNWLLFISYINRLVGDYSEDVK